MGGQKYIMDAEHQEAISFTFAATLHMWTRLSLHGSVGHGGV